ncbi:Tht1-like nuclear fusion protein-domain-containing protein, partial [Catenaria anguillulae PL171]
SIQKYQANSHDCYKEAASMLQKGCKELTIKQEEKIQYAVRLTMCEVATANMNVPTSCSQANPPSACVEALAQVPQLWTSYSGYFREVMAMCYAVRHQIERELVESLFYNLTLAQLVNTNLLQQHAQDMSALHAQELATLASVSKAQDDLKSHATELGKWAAGMVKDVGGMSEEMGKVARSVNEIDRVQKQVQLALRASKEEVGKWVEGVREDTVALRHGLQVVAQDVSKHFQQQQQAQESMQLLMVRVVHCDSDEKHVSLDVRCLRAGGNCTSLQRNLVAYLEPYYDPRTPQLFAHLPCIQS